MRARALIFLQTRGEAGGVHGIDRVAEGRHGAGGGHQEHAQTGEPQGLKFAESYKYFKLR